MLKVAPQRVLVVVTALTTCLPAFAMGSIVPTARAGVLAEDAISQPIGSNRVVSVRPNGKPPEEGASGESDVSANGRYVAYSSKETYFGRHHVYVRDRKLDRTESIDVRPDGEIGNGVSYAPSISADGRLVAFQSPATDLAEGGGPRVTDVFLRDVAAGTTSVLSVPARGRKPNGDSGRAIVSANGSTVVFDSLATNLVRGEVRHEGVYQRDLGTSTTTLISKTPEGDPPNGKSYDASTSANGNLIAYSTAATDIVPDGFAGAIVLYDVAADTAILVNRTPGGEPADDAGIHPVISADGNTVMYYSRASNLVSGDTNDKFDVFSYDVESGRTTMVSWGWDGSPANGDSTAASVSGDGQTVSFGSYARNLVPGHDSFGHHVYAYDMRSGTTTLLSKSPRGRPGNGISDHPSVSDDGFFITYTSMATNLVRETRSDIDRVYAYRVR